MLVVVVILGFYPRTPRNRLGLKRGLNHQNYGVVKVSAMKPMPMGIWLVTANEFNCLPWETSILRMYIICNWVIFHSKLLNHPGVAGLFLYPQESEHLQTSQHKKTTSQRRATRDTSHDLVVHRRASSAECIKMISGLFSGSRVGSSKAVNWFFSSFILRRTACRTYGVTDSMGTEGEPGLWFQPT